MSEDKTNIIPEEVSFDDAASAEQLRELLARKAHEKIQIANTEGLIVLKKSKFYYATNGNLREHIATYKDFAILIKQENIKEEINDKENRMFPSLVSLEDLRKMKRVNGNVVRRIQPDSLHEFEKMALIQAVVSRIEEGV